MDNINQLLIEFYEKLSSWEHTVVKDSELTPSQMHTIEIIGNNKELRMKDISEKMGITTGTLTVMIDKLEKLKLVQRKQNSSDRRSYTISLTNKGLTHYKKHHKHHYNLTQDLISSLTKDEIISFTNCLKKIVNSL